MGHNFWDCFQLKANDQALARREFDASIEDQSDFSFLAKAFTDEGRKVWLDFVFRSGTMSQVRGCACRVNRVDWNFRKGPAFGCSPALAESTSAVAAFFNLRKGRLWLLAYRQHALCTIRSPCACCPLSMTAVARAACACCRLSYCFCHGDSIMAHALGTLAWLAGHAADTVCLAHHVLA